MSVALCVDCNNKSRLATVMMHICEENNNISNQSHSHSTQRTVHVPYL